MKKENVDQLLEVLLQSFQKDGIEVFASVCCGRIYIGTDKPASCGTCSRIPNVFEVNSEFNAEKLSQLSQSVQAQCE